MNLFKKLSVAVAALFLMQVPSVGYADKQAGLTIDEVNQALGDFGGDAAVELAKVVQSVFAKVGEPTAMIVGDEMQGSFIVGFRKGDGRLIFHGQRMENAPLIRWSAPSIGINVGGSVSKVAILVYNAQSEEELKQAFASIQGSYHFIGGAAVSYLSNSLSRKNGRKINLVHISVGLGLDAGVAVERLKFK
jgi:hypothetical protein